MCTRTCPRCQFCRRNPWTNLAETQSQGVCQPAHPPTASIKRKHPRGELRLRRLDYLRISWETVWWAGGEWERRYSARPHPFLQQACGLMFKDDVNEFSFISDSSFMASMDSNLQCIRLSVNKGIVRLGHIKVSCS
jgi:hypothetical protein